MNCIEQIFKSTYQESAVSNIDGWLFTDFTNKDSITKELLSIPEDLFPTRRWIYIVLANNKDSIKISHTIESDILCHLPATQEFTYSSYDELNKILKQFSNKTFAVLSDINLPVISTVDGGFIDLLHSHQINTVSAASLIQRCKGLLSPAGINSHERASVMLYKIAEATWNFIIKHYEEKKALTEADTAAFIMKKFIDYNLRTSHAPIVAFGKNTANPHYQVPPSGGAVAKEGDTIQIDMWAKERIAPDDYGRNTAESAIYADISIVGVYSSAPDSEQEKMFETIKTARNNVVSVLEEAFEDKRKITGAQIDLATRKIISDAGYGSCIMHRTGHGIDTNCHGSGVNLDGTEFPDNRTILRGSCFSVEPGIYTNEAGMRTEINVYISENDIPVISGIKYNTNKENGIKIPQEKILTIKDRFNENCY